MSINGGKISARQLDDNAPTNGINKSIRGTSAASATINNWKQTLKSVSCKENGLTCHHNQDCTKSEFKRKSCWSSNTFLELIFVKDTSPNDMKRDIVLNGIAKQDSTCKHQFTILIKWFRWKI